MNQKLKKALAERERKAQRITEMQARNKELDKMIADMEYAELQDMLRGAGMSFEEFTRRFPEMLAMREADPEDDSAMRYDDSNEPTQEDEYESEETSDAGEEADGAAADGADFGSDFGDDAGGDWDLR